MRYGPLRGVGEALREWRWFALAVCVSAAWLWSNRYQVVSCDQDGICVVANRWSGKVGHKFTPLAADEMYPDGRRSGRDSANVAKMLREVGP